MTDPSLEILEAAKVPQYNRAERLKRLQTFYKQKKYTLAREAVEGYASLVVLLCDERFLGKGGDAEDPIDRAQRAKALWKECMSIVGWFDLNPQRVLDMILDAFCQKVTTHWRFYLDLLENSIWNKKNMVSSPTDTKEADAKESPSNTNFAASLASETGNKVLTQVLGFKFAYHRYSAQDLKTIEEDPEPAPQELLYVTAILIRQGFVRTLDILPLLTPEDDAMDSLARRYRIQTQKDIRNLGGNALVMAAALPDDDNPRGSSSAQPEDEAVKVKKELPEQKIQLCEALLAIGHLPPALFIIFRWPVVAQYSERVAILIMRIVRFALMPAYGVVEAHRVQDFPAPGPTYRTHFPFSEPETVDTIYCPEPLDTERRRFRFFFTEWYTRLERWHNPEEVITKVQPFMSMVGARAASDVTVLVWLCRIGVYLQQKQVSMQRSSALRHAL